MEMTKTILFNSDIIIIFYDFFKKFSSKIKDDGVINYNKF